MPLPCGCQLEWVQEHGTRQCHGVQSTMESPGVHQRWDDPETCEQVSSRHSSGRKEPGSTAAFMTSCHPVCTWHQASRNCRRSTGREHCSTAPVHCSPTGATQQFQNQHQERAGLALGCCRGAFV